MLPEPVDFSKRAYLSEWMDEPCSYETFRGCLIDLAKMNRTVLAYRPTERWLQQFAGVRELPLHIVDVGCGGGDMLRRVEAWAASIGFPVTLTGIDLNPFAARAAREFSQAGSRIEWITGDAFSYGATGSVDIVISSLFTHHLPDTEVQRFVQWMERVARKGWFISDLHRQRFPYYGYKLLARAMRWHPFVRHDGPISFRRSFRKRDWEGFCAAAGLHEPQVSIFGAHPGRLCVSRVK